MDFNHNPWEDTNPHTRWNYLDGWIDAEIKKNGYGAAWPKGTSQAAIELTCFKAVRSLSKKGKRPPGTLPAFYHLLNAVRILFPDKIEIYKDIKKSSIYKSDGRIYNNFFLDALWELCLFKPTILCGPASAAKTYTTAVYTTLSWMSDPAESASMVSTTSGSSAERRVWGDIKDLHREAHYEEAGMHPVGEIIDYKMAIVFDEGKQLNNSDKNNRDYRNSLILVPIARDSTGENALLTIQGTKNKNVIWVVDEMTLMANGITRPCGNLIQNEFFQFIGIGNSDSPNDPHGVAAMPKDGLSSLNHMVDRRWISASGRNVLFLSGMDSPNAHPLIDQNAIDGPIDYPFKYLSNPFSSKQAALEEGFGDIEAGMKTIQYWKFQIGFWVTSGVASTVFSENLIKNFGADKKEEPIIYNKRTFAGNDLAFSSEGDNCCYFPLWFGYTANGQKVINLSFDAKSISPNATVKEDYIKQSAKALVDMGKADKVTPRDTGVDTGNDGALTLQEMYKYSGTTEYTGISSTGSAVDKERYENRVSELWIVARKVIKTGLVRGFNTRSGYASQLFNRMFSTKPGKDGAKSKIKIEPKKDMKKRIGRSPDDADAFVYAFYMLVRSGVIAEELAKVDELEDAGESYLNTQIPDSGYAVSLSDWVEENKDAWNNSQLTENTGSEESYKFQDDEQDDSEYSTSDDEFSFAQ